MSQRIGLWVGDSFAEAVTLAASSSIGTKGTFGITENPTRWFLSKKNLTDGLREVVAGLDVTKGGEIILSSSQDESILRRRIGGPVAFLVTSGFETWVKSAPHPSHTPLKPAAVPNRIALPISSDHIFGIDERLDSEGNAVKPLKTEELEFLAAKLELLKVKDIAIGFLHARKNSSHEAQAKQYFEEKGFRVVASHQLVAAPNEVLTWRRAIERAYVASARLELEAQVRASLGEAEGWTIKQISSDEALIQAFNEARTRGGARLAMHFGLEKFSWTGAETIGGVARAGTLPVQPTCQIGITDWPFPSWTAVDRGYEPGPMMFGKSHQLTWLDVLSVRERMNSPIDAFSDKISEKSRSRILETLTTLGRNLIEPGRRSVDALAIASDLELMGIERICGAIEMLAPATGKNGQAPIEIWGSLAPILAPLIAARRPDLELRVRPEISLAGAALAGTVA